MLREVSIVIFNPFNNKSFSSNLDVSTFEVFHLVEMVVLYSFSWYLPSKLPDTFPLSWLDTPEELSSTPVVVFVFTSSFRRPKQNPFPKTSRACFPRSEYSGG